MTPSEPGGERDVELSSPAQRITFQQLVTLQRASHAERTTTNRVTLQEQRETLLLLRERLRQREERCPFLQAEEEEPLRSGSSSPLDDGPEVVDFSRPVPCSFLREGQTFVGQQTVQRASSHKNETWRVVAKIHAVDWERGLVQGTLAADNVPQSTAPVVTLWNGEIVDNVNASFITSKWCAESDIDRRHWRKFEEYQPLKRQVARYGGRCPSLKEWGTIFMRWKETQFLGTSDECGLTIAGFYYMALKRQTGTIEGYYYDSQSTPYQRVDLAARCDHADSPGLQSFGCSQFR